MGEKSFGAYPVVGCICGSLWVGVLIVPWLSACRCESLPSLSPLVSYHVGRIQQPVR